MSQAIPGTINPNTTSGTQLASIIDGFVLAFASGNSGVSRPSNLQQYGYWMDTTDELSDLISYKFYDGTTDHELFKVNINTGQLILTATESTLDIIKTSDDAIGALFTLQKKRIAGGGQVLTNDVIGELLFKSTDASDVSYTAAKIKSTSLNDVTSSIYGAYLSFFTTALGSNILSEKMRLSGDGKLGLGVDAPLKTIHIKNSGTDVGVLAHQIEDDITGAEIGIKKERESGNGQVLSGDIIGRFPLRSTDQNGADIEVGVIEYTAIEDHTDVAQGTKVSIKVKGETDAAYTTVFEADGDDLLLKGYLSDRLEFSPIVTPVDTPSAGKYFVYLKSDGQMYIKNDAGLEKALGGGGAGGRTENYIDDFDFSAGTLSGDWGGSGGNLSIAYESGSPLRGTGSAKITAASAAIDDYVKYGPFTLDTIDHIQALTLVMDQLGNANYEDGDIHWKIVADPAGTPTVIGSLRDLGLVKAGIPKHISQYQSLPSSEGTSYELRAYNTRAAASYELTIDNIELKNQDFLVGGSGTSMSFAYTQSSPTQTTFSGTFAGSSNLIFSSASKVVDSLGSYNSTTGEITIKETGQYYFYGFGDLTGTYAVDQFVGLYIGVDSGSGFTERMRCYERIASASLTSAPYKGYMLLDLNKGDKVAFRIVTNLAGAAIRSVTNAHNIGGFKVGNNGGITSLGGEILSEIDYRGNGGQSITAGVTDISFATPFNVDKLGEWDGNGFVAKTTKTYIFSGLALFTTALNADLNSYIGGVFDRTVNTAHGIAEQGKNFICIVKLQAGERWSLRSGASGTLSNNNNVHYINVNALAETSNGIAPEQVKTQVIANANNSQFFVNNNEIVCIFNQDRVDSHGIYNDVNGQTVLEQGGNYTVKAFKQFTATTWTADDIIRMYVRVNGTEVARLDIQEIDVTKSYEVNMNGSVDYDFEKGDVVDVALFHTRTGGSITSFGQTTRNHFSIRKN